MTRARVAAAIAAIATALLLQATLVGPVLSPSAAAAVSLPAVLVVCVALVDGPAAGMSFGFATGLAADLASRHPAGLLALCWLGAGLLAGLVGEHRRRLRDSLLAGALCAVAGAAATVLLAVTNRGGTALDAVTGFVPVLLVGAVLALVVLPLVRRMLHTEYLRAPHPVYTELTLEPARGR